MATSTTPTPTTTAPFTISPAISNEDLKAIHALFTSYTNSLNLDLTFQSLASELATLPGAYSPAQNGALLLARSSTAGEAIGCVGLRSLQGGVCEMKRLYVAPSAQGTGLGKALAVAVIAQARRLGYRAIRLDTLPRMVEARGLYARLGFGECERYYETPLEGTVFMELDLGDHGAGTD